MADPRSPFAAPFLGGWKKGSWDVPAAVCGQGRDTEELQLLLPNQDAPKPSQPGIPHSIRPMTQPLHLPSCLQGTSLAKPHDMMSGTLAPPATGAHPTSALAHSQATGAVNSALAAASPGWESWLLCLSEAGRHALAVGDISLFSLQNSLKKRGSRSIGKTEKKPSVQVWAMVPARGCCHHPCPVQAAGWVWGGAVLAAGGFYLSLAVALSCCEALMLLPGLRGAELPLW